MDKREEKKYRVQLLCASFLALFTELSLIRFIPGHIPFVSYFTNIILIACFFGLGLGFVYAKSHVRWNQLFLPVLIITVLYAKWFDAYGIVYQAQDTTEPFWTNSNPGADKIELPLLLVVLLSFACATISCIPVGQSMGQCFIRLERLTSYNLDLIGSLLGVVFFAFISFLHTPPYTWFTLIAIIAVTFFYKGIRQRLSGFFIGTLLVLCVLFPLDSSELWSSYYRVNTFKELPSMAVINTNNVVHQVILDLDSDDKNIKISRSRYSVPYEVLKQLSPQIDLGDENNCILIVGAGSGNDIAIARDLNIACIHAVEIDRAFSDLGASLHPQKPYNSENVSLFIDDARAYFKKAYKKGQRYAVIIFATLDSMSLTGGLSTRLDSYVYTKESFSSAYDLLIPGGIIGVFHMSQRDYISGRIAKLLYSVNDQFPLVRNYQDYLMFNWMFIQAKDIDLDTSGLPTDYLQFIDKLRIPSDDWPFLFLEAPVIPLHYIEVLACIIILAILVVYFSIRGKVRYFDVPLFLLGAGFLLLETKSVTQMSMLFGSTWFVNILVFSSILGILIFANLFVRSHGEKLATGKIKILFIFMTILLIVLSSIPVSWVNDKPDIIQWVYASIIVAMPVGIAGVLFPILFKKARNTEVAFASNLLGAVMGGVLEYLVMIVGISAMGLVVALLYLSAFFFWLRMQNIS